MLFNGTCLEKFLRVRMKMFSFVGKSLAAGDLPHKHTESSFNLYEPRARIFPAQTAF